MDNDGMAAMEKKVTLSWLLSFYGSMLTDNQREMARLHWEEDYSLAEIAAQFSITRQSVHDTVSRTEKQLEGLEEKLGMLKRYRAAEDALLLCRRELSQVKPQAGTEGHLAAACRAVEKLLDQEEE